MRRSKGKLVGVLFAALIGAVASAAPTAQAAKVGVRIVDADQKSALGSGLTVEVRAPAGARVSLTAFSKTFDQGLTRSSAPRRVLVGPSGRAIARVRLTGKARRGARDCGARTFLIKARGAGRGSTQAEMERNLSGCRLPPVDLSRAEACDFIARPSDDTCLLPFPNDYYTRTDNSSPTKRRLALTDGAMPRNKSGKPIAAADYLPSDGFSHGQPIMLKVPGVDSEAAVKKNGFVGLAALSRYSKKGQRAVVIDTKTAKRWPIWVEVDANASTDAKRAMIISPAVNFEPGRRYVVALRNLVNAKGRKLEAPAAFRYFRDSLPSGQRAVNQRREHFEGIFRVLRRAKVKRSSLYLAWDFTTASNGNNYGRALSMRNRAFAELGDTNLSNGIVEGVSPSFNVTSVSGDTNPAIARRIQGTFTVPCFMEPGCFTTGKFNLGEDGLPTRNGNWQANFQCIVPTSGLTPGAASLRPYVYGHGLVGSANEVRGGVNPVLANGQGMLACATDEIGMSSGDLGTIAIALQDLSNFHWVADRLQQGLLNELFLARLLVHPNGFASHPAFQDGDGTTPGNRIIRPNEVYYVGASQGGIMGGPLTALSPDFTRSALIVGAMNYSTLLARSSDWPDYAEIMYEAYQDELVRPLVLSLIQMLWDRGEPNGYSHVMTDDPPPGTPEHTVSMHIALGDHQVSNFASDVQARTIGASTNAVPIDPRRWPNYEALWNVPRLSAGQFPFSGNSIIYWDGGPPRPNPSNPSQLIGTGVPPYANVPPNPDWEDPHGAPRGATGPIAMISTFLQPNGFIDPAVVCGGAPCLGDGWDGNYSALP